MPWSREDLARAPRAELKGRLYVNLGIGIPTLVAKLHSARHEKSCCSPRTAMLGTGPFPFEGEEDADLINAASRRSRRCR